MSGERIPVFLLLLARMALSYPFGLLESVVGSPRPGPGSLAADPVFILGHYRSGTTLLHKLLAADPRFGTVSTFDLLFPHCPSRLEPLIRIPLQGVANVLRVKQRFFHDLIVRLDDPNELEPHMLATGSPWSIYWGYLFPTRAFEHLDRHILWPSEKAREAWKHAYDFWVRRLSRRKCGRRLVLKDPPNTGRVAALLELYPDARFVHISRDPYEVALSMRRLWLEVILPHYSLQRMSAEEVDAIIVHHYAVLMSGLEDQRSLIPPGHLAELRYEEFVEAPLDGIRKVYLDLDLPAFEEAEQVVRRRLDRDRSYRPAGCRPSPEPVEFLEEQLEDWRRKLGYEERP